MSYDTLSGALAAKRYESARRIGIELIGNPSTCTPENLILLHDAYVALADFHAARELLETHQVPPSAVAEGAGGSSSPVPSSSNRPSLDSWRRVACMPV